MMDPRRKPSIQATTNLTKRATRSTAGRWSLFTEEEHTPLSITERAREHDEAVTASARMLLTRYGILFRDIVQRETNIPKWRDLLQVLRRMEARGEVRGGRFVSGFHGEQYALPEAVESLRASRNLQHNDAVTIAACDPIHLAGVIIPGERTAAVAGKKVTYIGGKLLEENITDTVIPTETTENRIVEEPALPASPHLFA